MPTSITVAPGLIQSPRTISGRPIAAISNRRAGTPPANRASWNAQSVTVAFSASSNCATGLPTMLERPITTASSPASEWCTVLASRTQPSGVHGTSARHSTGEPAGIERMEPVNVLVRIDFRDDLVGLICGGSGNCTRMPLTRGSPLSARDQVEQFGFADVLGQLLIERTACRLRRRPSSCCGHRPCWRDCRPTSTTARPGTMPRSRRSRCTASVTLPRRSAEIVLPSMMRADMADC